jgi:hypothetical protein
LTTVFASPWGWNIKSSETISMAFHCLIETFVETKMANRIEHVHDHESVAGLFNFLRVSVIYFHLSVTLLLPHNRRGLFEIW